MPQVDNAVLRLRTEDVEWRSVREGLVALDHRTGSYLTINASGGVLWDALLEGCTLPDLVEALVDRFHIPQPTAVADVRDFLRLLHRHQLLVQHEV